MTSERWQQVKSVLDAALERPPDERDAYLEAAGADEELRAEVQSLLAAYEEAAGGSFLENTEGASFFGTTTLAGGQRIGPYRLIGEIGRGGMGTVYRAVRDDDQYEREVALKVIRPGWDTDALVRRFLSERQILASLEHPHIARLYDGGLTEDGRPYFAMEYADGRSIDAYCDAHRLTIRERLELFLKVARAVAYAHRRLVVHRDLKPSNILVREGNKGATGNHPGSGSGAGSGVPLLLDFGVAKLLAEEPEAGAAPVTRAGLRLMTPEYAAPEQARSEPVSTATDVYTLGVLLYELLTGRRPYRFEKRTPSVVERVICEEQPARPSAAVTRTAEADEMSEAIGRARGAKPEALRRTLKGDLDRIILKALRKNPERRYASAEAFADDIERYLEGRPVKARPATMGYRARKFARRNRWGVGVAAAMLLLIAGLTAFYTVRLARQRDRAQRQAARAEAVSAFLVDLFEASDPYERTTDSLTVHALLERGVQRVERELTHQPRTQAQMLDVMGRVYRRRGRYRRADTLLKRALRLKRRYIGPTHPETAATMVNLAQVHRQAGNYHAAEVLYREALTIQRSQLSAYHPDVIHTKTRLAILLRYMGDYAAAEALLRDVLARRRQTLGEDHLLTARTLNGLGMVLHNQGDLNGTEASFRAALTIRRKQLGTQHPAIASSLNNLAAVLLNKKRYDEAEVLFREALAMRRSLFGRVHPSTARTLNNLALVLREQGALAAAEPLFREALAIRRKLLGKHPAVAMSLYTLAGLLVQTEEFKEAEARFREALAIFRATLPEGHSLIGRTLLGLGRLHLARHQPKRAEPRLREGLRIQQAALGKRHWEVAVARGLLGRCLTALGRYEAAESFLQASYATLRAERGAQDPVTQRTLKHLGQLYAAWGKPEKAAAWRDSLAATGASASRGPQSAASSRSVSASRRLFSINRSTA